MGIIYEFPVSGNEAYDAMKTDLNWYGEYIEGESWCRGSMFKLPIKYGKFYDEEIVYNRETDRDDLWSISDERVRAHSPKEMVEMLKTAIPLENSNRWMLESVNTPCIEYYRTILDFNQGIDGAFIIKKIIEELTEIQRYGEENGINFEWI